MVDGGFEDSLRGLGIQLRRTISKPRAALGMRDPTPLLQPGDLCAIAFRVRFGLRLSCAAIFKFVEKNDFFSRGIAN